MSTSQSQPPQISEQVLDITPDPKVLLALTHTPLRPLDALCELIDNAIDSFKTAILQGIPQRHPLIEVTVPGETETRKGEGFIRVIDYGCGLDREGLTNALRAGYSGKNRYDTLGLFGMGFNIATGKLGRRTTVTTAREQDEVALRVVIDLPELVRNRSFEVPFQIIPKPQQLAHGTIVEVAGWWPEGDPNAGFATQLAKISKTQLRARIGRRYATILRNQQDGRIRIHVNGGNIEPFEHCVWSSDRFVERQGWGMIPARIDLDAVIFSQRRCVFDGAVLDERSSQCSECGASEFRTVEERIRGWVGIQRFDDTDKFGIDLIRNGRAIREFEKDAFFNFVDELGEISKEYPSDQQTGRIIGEIHLDHVPVDFQKQDFQRSSEEWQRAIRYLRSGSLWPTRWPEGERNETPVSKLFQGYRKVRNFGRADMYMGRYDEGAGKAVRIGREVEKELYERFLNKELGYFDDARWWELIENATIPPVSALEDCPECGYQNMPGIDTCEQCGKLLRTKPCVSCGTLIAYSAVSCPDCGASQIPEVEEPWHCAVCGSTNGIEKERCGTCDGLRGAENPIAIEVLRRDAEALPILSFENRGFLMADGKRAEPLDMRVFRSGTLKPIWNGHAVPTVAFKSAGSIEMFIDTAHPVFTQLGSRVEESVSIEAAQYLYNMRADLIGKPSHSIQNITSQILADVWGENLTSGPEKVKEMIKALFEKISSRLENNEDAADFYDELDQFEQRELADRLISVGLLNQIAKIRSNGAYLSYAGPSVLAKFFSRKPNAWFGTVWAEHLPNPAEVGHAAAENACEQIIGVYARCLDDCAAYLRYANTDRLIIARARASRDYLEERLT